MRKDNPLENRRLDKMRHSKVNSAESHRRGFTSNQKHANVFFFFFFCTQLDCIICCVRSRPGHETKPRALELFFFFFFLFTLTLLRNRGHSSRCETDGNQICDSAISDRTSERLAGTNINTLQAVPNVFSVKG
ncbi:hypothetical protein ISCGN_001626 [Ixodes scapularis]